MDKHSTMGETTRTKNRADTRPRYTTKTRTDGELHRRMGERTTTTGTNNIIRRIPGDETKTQDIAQNVERWGVPLVS